MEYLIAKWLHIGFSTILFGTGVGSAFYFLTASRANDARITAFVSARVVLADWLFTTPMVILQPASGLYLMHLARIPFDARWIHEASVLYAIAIAAWIPVVWLQLRMRDLAGDAAWSGQALPPRYFVLLRWWIALGVVAFVAFVWIFYLMVVKPQ